MFTNILHLEFDTHRKNQQNTRHCTGARADTVRELLAKGFQLKQYSEVVKYRTTLHWSSFVVAYYWKYSFKIYLVAGQWLTALQVRILDVSVSFPKHRRTCSSFFYKYPFSSLPGPSPSSYKQQTSALSQASCHLPKSVPRLLALTSVLAIQLFSILCTSFPI